MSRARLPRAGLGLLALSLACCAALAACGFQPVPAAPEPATVLPAVSPAPEAPAPGREFTLLACGDILLSRTPGKRAAEFGYEYLFKGVRDLVSGADIAFANLETPISLVGRPYPGKPANVTFRADPESLRGLSWAGFDVVSLANNHMNDYGPRAVLDTLRYVDGLGLARCGAGADLEEARRPAVMDLGGARFVFLAYAEPIWSVVAARSSEPARRMTRAEERLYGPLPASSPPADPDSRFSSTAGIAAAVVDEVAADVARAKASLRPDYLFVSVHWGDEHQHLPNGFQKRLGRACIDAGATAVLGHHPHVLQSIERYGDGLIIYSMGNFVFDMAADHTYETAAFLLRLKDGRVSALDVLPVKIERGSYVPSPARPSDSRAILAALASWSRPLPLATNADGTVGRVVF